jgi:CBS domain-containing protein
LGDIIAYPSSIHGILWYLGRINLILGLFNLIPAFPLDGGRALRALIWRFRNNLIQATRIASTIGSGFAFILIAAGFFFLFNGSFIGGIWWILIGFFLHSASRGSYNQLLMVEALSGRPVKEFMKTDVVIVPADISVSELVEEYIYTHHYKLFPVVSGNRLQGCVTTKEVKEVGREKWSETSVRSILNTCSETNTIPPDMDAGKALSIMQRSENSRLMVVDGGEIQGIVTLKDLMHYLSMKLDLEGDHNSDRRF